MQETGLTGTIPLLWTRDSCIAGGFFTTELAGKKGLCQKVILSEMQRDVVSNSLLIALYLSLR